MSRDRGLVCTFPILPAVDLYEKMLALHPIRVNPGSLWATAKALNGSAKASE